MAIGRRDMLAGLGALGAFVGSRTAFADEARPRVLIVGSSQVAGVYGQRLGRALHDGGFEVRRVAKSASGLSRPDFFDWPRTVTEELRSFEPDVSVAMFGANDAQGIRMPAGSPEKWIRWPEREAWMQEYSERVERFVATLEGSAQRPVVWVGLPAMRSPSLERRVEQIRSLQQQAMDRRANGHFVDGRTVLGDERGRYVSQMRLDGTTERVRAPDGVHIAGPGATLLVAYTLPTVFEAVASPTSI